MAEKVGEIKVDTSQGVVNLPVYNDSSSGSSVFEIIKVMTPSGAGYIPLTDKSNAAYPYIRVKTENKGILAFHDSASNGIDASGGTVSTKTIDGTDYKIHKFTSDGTFTVDSAPSNAEIEVLVVGGGGAGNNDDGSGGGGAGGLVFDDNYSVSTGDYTVTVGAGGSSAGEDGNDSYFETLRAIGGGGGGAKKGPGQDGGSGSGAGQTNASSGTPGEALQLGTNSNVLYDDGSDGGTGVNDNGGGGGGATQQGKDGGPGTGECNGGDGRDMSQYFTTDYGENGWFAGGGAGGNNPNGGNGNDNFGGLGGGGDSPGGTNDTPEDGQDGTGGGGGGRAHNKASGHGDGGDGIVLVRYEA